MFGLLKTEPVFVFGGLATLVGLIIPMLQLFDLIHWSDKQVGGVMAVVIFVTNFLAAGFARSQVVTNTVANRQIEVGVASPKGTSVQAVIDQTKAGDQ